jgi:hypothetical protein
MAYGEERSPDFFYGLQPRWLSWDRLYRVYVSDQMLAGAYIAGQVYDEQSAAVQLQQMGLVLRPLVRRLLAQRQQREARFDALDPFGPALLDQDPRNFQILRTDVARMRFRRNRSLWTAFNVGVVELELLDGTRRRFILVGDQEPDTVLSLLQRFHPDPEVTGKPNRRPHPKPMSPSGRRRTLVLAAGLLLGFGALFGYAAWGGIAPNPAPLPIAVVNMLLGGWCLARAWRVSENQPIAEEAGRASRRT